MRGVLRMGWDDVLGGCLVGESGRERREGWVGDGGGLRRRFGEVG